MNGAGERVVSEQFGHCLDRVLLGHDFHSSSMAKIMAAVPDQGGVPPKSNGGALDDGSALSGPPPGEEDGVRVSMMTPDDLTDHSARHLHHLVGLRAALAQMCAHACVLVLGSVEEDAAILE